MRIGHPLVLVVALFAPSLALACASLPRTPMERQVQSASTIAIFQLESTEFRSIRLGGDVVMPLLEGRVRVVEVLKGPRTSFKRFTLGAACNDLRLDVGDYFLLATTQHGELLSIGRSDASVLALSPAYQGGTRARESNSADLRDVLEFLSGKQLPKRFPSDARFQTEKYYLPPPCKRCGKS